MARFISFVFILVGLGGIAFSIVSSISEGEPLVLLVGLFFSVFFYAGIHSWRQTVRFEAAQAERAKKNFSWYKETYPECVGEKGKVTCHACGGGKFSIQKLLNRTFFMAHVCSTCGTTLYFSREP